jgi:hypothetical protein
MAGDSFCLRTNSELTIGLATERNSHRRSVLAHQLLATAGLGDALRFAQVANGPSQ